MVKIERNSKNFTPLDPGGQNFLIPLEVKTGPKGQLWSVHKGKTVFDYDRIAYFDKLNFRMKKAES